MYPMSSILMEILLKILTAYVLCLCNFMVNCLCFYSQDIVRKNSVVRKANNFQISK